MVSRWIRPPLGSGGCRRLKGNCLTLRERSHFLQYFSGSIVILPRDSSIGVSSSCVTVSPVCRFNEKVCRGRVPINSGGSGCSGRVLDDTMIRGVTVLERGTDLVRPGRTLWVGSRVRCRLKFPTDLVSERSPPKRFRKLAYEVIILY